MSKNWVRLKTQEVRESVQARSTPMSLSTPGFYAVTISLTHDPFLLLLPAG